jgi:hypothetical protein
MNEGVQRTPSRGGAHQLEFAVDELGEQELDLLVRLSTH